MAQTKDTSGNDRVASNSNSKTNTNALYFSARLVEPRLGQAGCYYYIRTDTTYNGKKGYNTNTSQGNKAAKMHKDGCSALYNCVAYMWGRINEISGAMTGKEGWKYAWSGDGGKIFGNAPTYWPGTKTKIVKGYAKYNPTPQVGAIICWGPSATNTSSPGHVAVVEKVHSDGSITLSESAYSYLYVESPPSAATGWNKRTVKPPNYAGSGYVFQGFIYHPDIPVNSNTSYGGDISPMSTFVPGETVAQQMAEYNAKQLALQQTVVTRQYNQMRGMDLLSSTTLVESPFIEVTIGDYTFGSYTKEGSLERANATMKVTYPNYMESLNIIKTNGTLNVYTLNMVYQIVPGKDPNLLDRIFSTISNTREIKLSYGDWASPSFIYKEEEAIITKVVSKIDFASQKITYTVSCTSKALKAASQTFDFPARTAKGSDVIKGLLADTRYGLLEVFPGMANTQLREDAGLIPGDDKAVSLEAQTLDPIKYLDYVVSCMTASTNSDNDVIKDSTYHFIIMDDIENDFGGAYFKIVRIGTTTRNLISSDTYEVDIGYPTSTLVTDFNINTDNSWAILYNYADEISTNNYVYSIDNDGNVRSDYVNNSSAVSSYYNRATEASKTWWTKMTQFPITATLTIKGLLRPAILMNYLRINTYFYGQKHISSGLYVITKQEDTINASGFRTVLSLTRIAGDSDETYNYVQTNVEKTDENTPKFSVDPDPNDSTTNIQTQLDEQKALREWEKSQQKLKKAAEEAAARAQAIAEKQRINNEKRIEGK